MSQTVRTIVFLGVAVVCVGIGFATHSMYKPVDLDAFSDVGQEFYPEFDDPNEATGLRVASYNEDTSQTETFSVEFKNGLWRIPSHHDYPADGQEQLAKTAASMVGVERQALIERTKAAHKRYDLLDPLDQSVTGTEGRGDRITLYKGDEELVDFIVGKPVEGRQNEYYVRAANEDRFYTADLGDFEISTKFADWIEKDILNMNRADVREIVINRYQIDEARGALLQGDRLNLSRESSSADWQLEGLEAKSEELETANINSMLTALDDLAIVGVRKKPAGISADLKAEEGVSITALDMLDLQDKGFFIDQRQGRILSNEGEVLVGTKDGILYALRFGEEFSGSDVDIEVGSKSSKEQDGKQSKQDDPDETASDDDSASADQQDSDLLKSRYLFVTAQFDAELLGEKPTPPVKPEPPATPDAKPSETTEQDQEQKSDDDAAQPDPQKEYEEALKRYEEEQEVYEIKLKDYEESVAKGQERVAELNRRFADWYYVISAEVFDRMKLNRTDLVKAKEAPPEEQTPPTTPVPGDAPEVKTEMKKPEPATETTEKPAEQKKPETTEPEKEKKATEATEKPDNTTQPEKKTDEGQPAPVEKSADAKPENSSPPEAPAKEASPEQKQPADPAEKPAEPAQDKSE